jgi:type IV pilus assembly protein PilM
VPRLPISGQDPSVDMAFSLRKNNARGSVGLDIDGRFLAAVQAENGGVQRAASAELPDGVVAEGEVTNRDSLAAALKGFFKAHELPKSVRLGVSNQQIVVRQIEVPALNDDKERDAAIRFQAADAIAMPLDEAVLDYQLAGEVHDEGGARSKFVVVAARRPMVDALLEATRAAGLKPQGVDLDAFALVRTLAAPEGADDVARVYCHLGGVTTLAIAIGTTCIFTRAASTTLDPDSEDSASELSDEIRLSIDYYRAQPGAIAAHDLVLSGPGAAHEGVADRLGSAVGLPVTVAEPLGTLYASGLPAGDDPARYTVAAGLAIGAAA